MTSIENLRTAFRVFEQNALSLDYYTALTLADDLVNALIKAQRIDVNKSLDYIAANDSVIRGYFANQKKFSAIKELRILSGCGLREAKDSVERVYGTDWSHGTDADAALARLREKLTGE
jgi:hypothetical protein